MEEAPETGKESSNSAHASGMNKSCYRKIKLEDVKSLSLGVIWNFSKETGLP
jgi:hypothetical protein